jgi:hypothetical protein
MRMRFNLNVKRNNSGEKDMRLIFKKRQGKRNLLMECNDLLQEKHHT